MDPAGEMMEAPGSQKHRGPSAGGLSPLVEAMLRPEFYPDSPAHVEVKQTHISYVFIAGDFVYKIKKPVHFPFLDCSKLADRLRYCREEVRLNTRLSPRVYLGVFAILKSADSFMLGPEVHGEHPEAVEYAVKMRRLPEDRMLDKLLTAGQVDESLRSLEREVDPAERERARQLASSYYALAWRYARCASPSLIIVCGLSGSGKSTVARMLQYRKGFKAINSDRVRKRLASVAPHEQVWTG